MMAILGAVTLGAAVALYVALAMGFPLGEFAMGGKYKVMPAGMRLACAVSVFVQMFAIVVILQAGGIMPLVFSQGITRGICFFFAAFLSLNVLMNFLSRSKKEKWAVGPVSVVTSVCFWFTAFKA